MGTAGRGAGRSLRVAVVGEPAGWHVGRLRAALEARGHRAPVIPWRSLAAEVGPPAAGGPPGERFLPAALATADVVAVRGMPAGSLEEVIFRMDVLGRFAAAGTPVVNDPRALEVAIDKYLSLARMAAAGLPVPRTIVAQDAAAIEEAFAALGGDCVAKPIFGSRGRGLVRITDPGSLAAAAVAPAVAGGPPPGLAYLQEFVPHEGWDVRVLVVGDRTISMRRIAVAGDWRTNVSLGGRPEAFVAPPGWLDLARRAAAVLGAGVAGVDLLPARDGRVLVLEVNAVPGWKGLEAATGVDIADVVVRFLESRTV
jgi:ribosomal protein S6--L-glutamate ligase